MSKSIWHTQKETPEDDRLIVVENYSGFISVGSEFEYDLDRVRKWAYFDDLLALEAELDRTRKALGIAVDALKVYANPENWDFEHFYSLKTYDIAKEALDQIKALDNKDE